MALIGCPGILVGTVGVFALLRRTHLSQILGAISIGLLILFVLQVPRKSLTDWSWFALYLAPGISAIVFNQAPRAKPGQCPTCHNDMANNTTGICAECGEIVSGHCKTCGYNLIGNVSGKCSECGATVVAP